MVMRSRFRFSLPRGRLWKWLCWVALAGLTSLYCLMQGDRAIGTPPPNPVNQAPVHGSLSPTSLDQQGRNLYEQGRYQDAVRVLRQALPSDQNRDPIGQSVILSNLAATYQQLGAWTEANTAIQQAIDRLETSPAMERLPVLAQVLEVQGGLQQAQGQAEAALTTWQRAAQIYEQLNQSTGRIRSQLNQAQALQSLGLYRRAIALLETVQHDLEGQPHSLEKAVSLRSLGNALLVAGSSEEANRLLQESLEVAQAIQHPEAIAATHLSLGNLARGMALANQSSNPTEFEHATTRALTAYRQAALAHTPQVRGEALLSHLRFLINLERWSEATPLATEVQQVIDRLPPGRTAIYAQVNLAESLMKIASRGQVWGSPHAPGSTVPALPPHALHPIAPLLRHAFQQADALNDDRARSFVLGTLGTLYEQAGQWETARDLTQRALALADGIQAGDIAYRWEWQLGRLLMQKQDESGAIVAYRQATETLQSLRSDLVALNPDAQFALRKNAEPIYRQYVDVLLKTPTQEHLRMARTQMESLQLAQLENFLQQNCLGSTLQLDQVIDQSAMATALIYPIILPDRLEVIAKLPGEQDLYHYSPIAIAKPALEAHLHQLLLDLQEAHTYRAIETGSKQVYDWLITPVRDRLQQHQVKNLVFVMDGALRTIPAAALYDGRQYLVENYAVSMVLGLEIRDPEPLPERDRLRVLAGSVTTPPDSLRQEFSVLQHVAPEVKEIAASGLHTTTLEEFTFDQFKTTLGKTSFQVVHLATHGQFSSDRQHTFLVAADGKITVDELGNLFRDRDTNNTAVELLVLSACETATGDDRAVLGIAGTAVQAGARSAIASLWSLDDNSGAAFMQQFYQHLGRSGVSRSEALRLAQKTLAADSHYRHPRYWAPYVLVGNWL